jgi:hypothetical protein
MNGDELVETLRAEKETELSRLGSSKALYAVTGGEMAAGPVRTAAAAEAARAAAVFDAWADDEADADAAALFADVAEAEAARHEAVDADADPLEHPMYDRLADLAATDDRLAGLLARALVTHATVEQTVGFFVGDADPRSADEFRDVTATLADQRDRAVDAVDARDGVDDDALDAALAVVDAAYDYYVERLESMGVKPKNVC